MLLLITPTLVVGYLAFMAWKRPKELWHSWYSRPDEIPTKTEIPSRLALWMLRIPLTLLFAVGAALLALGVISWNFPLTRLAAWYSGGQVQSTISWMVIFSWMGIFVCMGMLRDKERIASNILHPYRLTEEVARRRGRMLACAIWLPACALFVGGTIMMESSRDSFLFACLPQLIALLWVLAGYVLTGGRSREEEDRNAP